MRLQTVLRCIVTNTLMPPVLRDRIFKDDPYWEDHPRATNTVTTTLRIIWESLPLRILAAVPAYNRPNTSEGRSTLAGQAASYGATPVAPALHLFVHGQRRSGILVPMAIGFCVIPSTLHHFSHDILGKGQP